MEERVFLSEFKRTVSRFFPREMKMKKEEIF
jgi:hypothetical protein